MATDINSISSGDITEAETNSNVSVATCCVETEPQSSNYIVQKQTEILDEVPITSNINIFADIGPISNINRQPQSSDLKVTATSGHMFNKSLLLNVLLNIFCIWIRESVPNWDQFNKARSDKSAALLFPSTFTSFRDCWGC